ncbi:hypothetical protein ABFS83_12G055500 [Erythranthe nasuta]
MDAKDIDENVVLESEKNNRPTKKPFPKTINCSYCKAEFKFDTKNNGTSAMLKHLKAVCRTSPIFKGKKGAHNDGKNQKTIGFKIEQKQIGRHGISVVNHSISQERCRKVIARMCIKENRPFSIVDDEGFREMLWELEPKFKVLSRWTESGKLKNLLNGRQRVSLSTDTWSSLVSDCLKVWGIERIFTITVDNASSNDGAIRFFKEELNAEDSILEYKYLHLRCCAHIVNLVGKEGLHDQFESIARIRNAVRNVSSSPSRYAKFKDSVEKAKLSCSKNLCLDVDTRWNSTYLMLDTAVKYAMAFKKNYDVKYSSYFSGGDEEDFECNTKQKEEIQNLRLKLVRMHVRLGRMCRNEDVIAEKMAIKMKEKYEKYWKNMKNMNNLLYIAVVLDPSCKLEFVDYWFKQIYGPTSPRVKQMNERLVNTLFELYAHYTIKEDDSNLVDDNSGSSASFMDVDDLESGKIEVDIYLGDRVEKVKGDNFDLLTWWKNNALKFPIISKNANHLLAMPISTIASGSAFKALICTQDWIRSSSIDIESQLLHAQAM